MSDKKKPGCLANLLAAVVLCVLVVWGIKSCGDTVFAPETPAQAKKRRQKEAKEDIAAIDVWARAEVKAEAEAKTEAEKWKQEELKQPERRELLEELVSKNVFRKIDFRDKKAIVWVGLPFYQLDFTAKETFASVVYAYVAANAKDDMVSVTLKDNLSGKTIGDYGQQWTSFGLKMK